MVADPPNPPAERATRVLAPFRRLLRATGADVVSEHWPGPPATLGVLLRAAGQPA
jgi:hypothetical protein